MGVLVVLLGLFVWPADFDLHAKGTLEPVDRSDVFALSTARSMNSGPMPTASRSKHAPVKQGQLLLRLRNHTWTRKTEIEGQVNFHRQQANDIEHDLSTNPSMAPDDRRGRWASWPKPAEPISLEAEAKIHKAKIADLELHSPIDGQIFTRT